MTPRLTSFIRKTNTPVKIIPLVVIISAEREKTDDVVAKQVRGKKIVYIPL